MAISFNKSTFIYEKLLSYTANYDTPLIYFAKISYVLRTLLT